MRSSARRGSRTKRPSGETCGSVVNRSVKLARVRMLDETCADAASDDPASASGTRRKRYEFMGGLRGGETAHFPRAATRSNTMQRTIGTESRNYTRGGYLHDLQPRLDPSE